MPWGARDQALARAVAFCRCFHRRGVGGEHRTGSAHCSCKSASHRRGVGGDARLGLTGLGSAQQGEANDGFSGESSVEATIDCWQTAPSGPPDASAEPSLNVRFLFNLSLALGSYSTEAQG